MSQKPLVKSKTVWSSALLGLILMAEQRGWIPEGLAEPIEAILGALILIFLRMGYGNLKLFMLVPLLFGAVYLGGCSYHSVEYTETSHEGVTTTVKLSETVPVGGSRLSEGLADIGVNQDGSWFLKLGASGDTDLIGTADLINSLIIGAYQTGLEASTLK